MEGVSGQRDKGTVNLFDGNTVEFEIEFDSDGRPKAIDVTGPVGATTPEKLAPLEPVTSTALVRPSLPDSTSNSTMSPSNRLGKHLDLIPD
ncbi:hypothetical protein H5410_026016 [Solanum commersonii]|uniref:Uncharacterized protein n=1 Tax=Solanum commersonii TaxID=4109 RepID=A0A9J5YZL1_SOLCO|nr:hypothetical protein H5410_026016 [Solanum commersonii]